MDAMVRVRDLSEMLCGGSPCLGWIALAFLVVMAATCWDYEINDKWGRWG